MFKTERKLLHLTIFSIILNSCSCGSINCYLKRLENCHQNEDTAWKINVTIKNVDKNQYIDGSMTFERPFDNDVSFNTTVKRLTNGKYLYLFSFQEHKACSALNKFYGEFLYEFERLAQIMPGMCPIQKGKYHWHNARLHLEKIPTLVSLPVGNLLITSDFYEPNNKFYACNLVEVQLGA